MNLETKITLYKFTPQVFTLTLVMATIRPIIFTSKPAKDGSHPIYICITSKNTRDYIMTPYRIDDACQWMDGKVVAHLGSHRRSCANPAF